MQRILAIAWLTWKAAFRFKLFLVIAVLLLAAVVGLPLLIKDDGTARGFTQIILTYTLSAITGLLGLSTLWLACGTLARDIEECQIQVVATKPIARWQIWLGKWLGIMSLNAALLALTGSCVFSLLQWRAGKLPAAEQQILREQVLVARGSAKEANNEAEITSETERILQGRLQSSPVEKVDLPEVRRQIRERAPVEKNNADDAQPAAEQQNNLRERRAEFAPGDAAAAAQGINRRKVFDQADHRQHALESRNQHHVRRRVSGLAGLLIAGGDRTGIHR